MQLRRFRPIAAALLAAGCVLINAATSAGPAFADPVSGAIFTTNVDGSEVNVNQYVAKPDVYLNGGPGVNAPSTAAGLSPDGVYVFQVTDPSGKVLLSQDPPGCRLVLVSGGNIVSIVAAPGPLPACQHPFGVSVHPGEETVELCNPVSAFLPAFGSCFNDTPNNGGVYKAWMTPLAQFQGSCSLTVVDCGNSDGYRHGFLHSDSKTDNFKVTSEPIREIDTQFTGSDGTLLDGMGVTWTDTVGATNQKWSEYDPNILAFHEAHVEAVEPGTHYITITNQPGCTIDSITTSFSNFSATGPATVPVKIPGGTSALSDHIYVDCV
jgi:hypothetical protein